MIVVDTNVIAYFIIPGDNTDLAEAVRSVDADWCSPALWRSEMRNILALYVRNGQIDTQDAIQMMSDAELLLVGSEFIVESSKVLEIAALSGCTAYDCEFISLAERLNVKMVTSDKKLLNAFPKIAVSMENFLN